MSTASTRFFLFALLSLGATACRTGSSGSTTKDISDAGGLTAQAGEACRGNVLGAKNCADGLVCVFPPSRIAGVQGVCTTTPPACQSATDCAGSGPLPALAKVCADGTTSSAHWSCKNSLCTVAVCDSVPAAGPTCAVAADCAGTGPLPATAKVCANGVTDSAHWSCVNSACTVTICDADPS